MPDGATVAKLAAELFALVEKSQGYAFVSDGEHFPTVVQFFERIRGRLKYSHEATKILEQFLRKHGELPDAPMPDELAEIEKAIAHWPIALARKESVLTLIRSELTKRDAEIERLKASQPIDLRNQGLHVAVHNDYRLAGRPCTFWLMTKVENGIVRAYKGEGQSDTEALDQIRAALASPAKETGSVEK